MHWAWRLREGKEKGAINQSLGKQLVEAAGLGRGNLNRVGSDEWTELNDEEGRNRRFRWAGDGELLPTTGP